jgi:hypothetical protein
MHGNELRDDFAGRPEREERFGDRSRIGIADVREIFDALIQRLSDFARVSVSWKSPRWRCRPHILGADRADRRRRVRDHG